MIKAMITLLQAHLGKIFLHAASTFQAHPARKIRHIVNPRPTGGLLRAA